jgi:outer membrane lipoprotein-sorting protein
MTPEHPETVRSLRGLAQVEATPEHVVKALEQVRATLLSSPAPELHGGRLFWMARVAAAVLLVAGVGGLIWWMSSAAGAGLAFADVQAQMRKSQTVTFKWVHERKGQPSSSDRVWIKAPSLIRVESADGKIVITDYAERKSLLLDPGERKAKLIQGLGLDAPNIYQLLRDVPKDAIKPLPEREIDGRQFPGFLVRIGFGKDRHEASVWIDRQTRLPVRIEISGKDSKGQEVREITEELVFDRALDATLFGLAAPAGYTVQTEGIAKLPASPKDQDVAAPIVTPKVGIGPARFGMSKDEVIRVLGQPDAIPAEGRGMMLQYFSRGYSLMVSPQRGLAVITCVSQKTFLVKVRDFRGKTPDGIGMGASAKDIEKAYGKPDRRENNGPTTVYLSYHRLGLNFVLFDDKVVQMMLQRP